MPSIKIETCCSKSTEDHENAPRAVEVVDLDVPRASEETVDSADAAGTVEASFVCGLTTYPIEGHDDEFDVELSSTSSVHSISSGSSTLIIMLTTVVEPGDSTELSNTNGTIYGKVVKSIQRSIRRIFHCGRDKVELLQPAQSSECFSETQQRPAQGSECFSEAQPEVPMSSIQTFNSPITSVLPGSDPVKTPTIHKTLLIDVSYTKPLLAPPMEHDVGRKCLVLDLDETLVHSTFQPVMNADLVVPVHLGEGVFQPIYVCKRPGVDEFLRHVSQHFEVVLFTASLSNYADPVVDFLDPNGGIRYRLYREDCLQFQGMYIKDLSRLGRDIEQVLIIDNSPASYSMHPHNALGCKSWFKDPHDRELEDRILPMLMNLKNTPTVSQWRSQNLQMIETPYA
ncbi:hypothetical protein PSACC_00241 [Paramicrosporidium saccamoebae]|uniref:FCP1 homology domain-containing protein n=1 Tax=Paramicrosporidium saccamoebae TaxID=1246581 RepID=A0A2H9TQF6_9FUNG|nr:hypothetical protein PSACC_00241 [Paramicrosporidium saccamoebae]